MIGRIVFLSTTLVALAHAAETYSYWVEPCPDPASKVTGCQAGDPDLARWALAAWERESNGGLTMREQTAAERARIRIRWASGAMNLYGETEPLVVEGRPGAQIFVLPDMNALGHEIGEAARRDPLFREGIVYLTCLHESGHALGLRHTAAFADIMYSFQFGGDILGYFERYRRQLRTRADIATHSGISDADRSALVAMLEHH